jgi:pantetheine-phosphate adenylyltransferase
MKILYPGTFDPITNGHLDLIERASGIFSEIYIAVINRPSKMALFTTQEREYLVRETTKHLSNVRIEIFDILLVEYARQIGIRQVLRGLRAVSDFEYEFQMALLNRASAPEIEFFYMMPSQQYTFLSSTMVKEIAFYKGPLSHLVSEPVEKALRIKMAGIE